MGEEHWESYQRQVEFIQAQKDDAEFGRVALRDYIDLLRIADFNDQAVDRASQKGWKRKKTAMASDAGYERAIERLSELLEADPSLKQFLDRHYDFDMWHGNNGVCRHSVPRPTFHKRYVYGNIEHQPFPTATELKVDALRKAIEQAKATHTTKEDNSTAPSHDDNMRRYEMLKKLIRR